MEGMRIFHLVANDTWGGGEQYVLDLCRRLASEGLPVTVVARQQEEVVRRFRNAKLTTRILPLKGVLDFKSAWGLARLLRAEERVVVHVHNFKSAFTAAYARKLAGHKNCRIILTRHLVKRGKRGVVYRWLYRQIDHIAFVSQLAQDEFLRGIASQLPPMAVVHNGVVLPSSTLRIPLLRREYSIPQGQVLLMAHGRLCPEKGIDTLIKALGSLKTANWVLFLLGAGDESYIGKLKEQAETLGILPRIHLLGFQADVSPYLAQADIGLVPSVVRESFSLSCAEYMGHGVAVISSDNGGQREFIASDVNGVLVPAGDSDSLSARIEQLIEDPDFRVSLGRQGRATFEQQLEYDIFYRKIQSIYHQLQ